MENLNKNLKLKYKETALNEVITPYTKLKIIALEAKKPIAINSGFEIGDKTLNLPAGAISIFTAPTSHGKTTLLLNTALNVAKKYQDKEFCFFSYEESAENLIYKALNIYINKDLSTDNRKSIKSRYATNSYQDIKQDMIEEFKEKEDTFFNELIETNRLNIKQVYYDSDTLITIIRELKKNRNLGGVFIDYIQLLNLPQGKYQTSSRQGEMKAVCSNLKDLAIETGLPIILGAQFNRTVTSPIHLHATNIGEAGDIERVANLIVGFWNNNFKGTYKKTDNIKDLDNYILDKGLYVKVLKHRDGITGLQESFEFNGNTGKIQNLQRDLPAEWSY